MAHFDTFLDLFHFFLVSSPSFEQGLLDMEKKVERNWTKKLTLPEKFKSIESDVKSTHNVLELEYGTDVVVMV